MWFPLLECFEFAQNFKVRFGTKDFNTNVNLFFIYFVFNLIVYLGFKTFSLALIKVRNILWNICCKALISWFLFQKTFKNQVKHRQSITPIFTIIFHLCSLSFLILYHNYFISPELSRESGKLFPKGRNSLLFFQPCDIVKFKIITFILASHNCLISFVELNSRDFVNAISKILYSSLLLTCYYCGYENYMVVLSINHGLYQLFTELLSLLALHSDKDHLAMFRIFVLFKFAAWIYIFLNFLPLVSLHLEFSEVIHTNTFCSQLSAIHASNFPLQRLQACLVPDFRRLVHIKNPQFTASRCDSTSTLSSLGSGLPRRKFTFPLFDVEWRLARVETSIHDETSVFECQASPSTTPTEQIESQRNCSISKSFSNNQMRHDFEEKVEENSWKSKKWTSSQ